MKSRSEWLKFTKHYQKSDRIGRKQFSVHKNDHNVIICPDKVDSSPDSSLVQKSQIIVNPPKELENQVKNQRFSKNFNSRTPEPPKHSNRSLNLQSEQASYLDKIKAKDQELKSLKKLYDNTSKRLEKYQKTVIQTRRMKIANEISDPQLPKNPQNYLPIITNKASTPDYKKNYLLDLRSHPAFAQPKYTKSSPKIVFSNPITGISPVF